MVDNQSKDLGTIIRQQRVARGLTLRELHEQSGVSPSHLGRIERGERFPSAPILRKIAQPLGFGEQELFTLANYLSLGEGKKETEEVAAGRLDPFVARMLAQETVETQRTVIGILNILKSIAKGIVKENR